MTGNVSSRRSARPAVMPWVLLALLLWAAQLMMLYGELASPTWSAYWYWRGVYRPGIQAVGATGGEHLPGHVFNPLSPAGAKWAFVLASGAYALAGTAVVWAMLRLTRARRQRTGRRLRRALA